MSEAEARILGFHLRILLVGQRPELPRLFSLLSQVHLQSVGTEVDELGPLLMLIWETDIGSGSLTYSTTMLAPTIHFISELF